MPSKKKAAKDAVPTPPAAPPAAVPPAAASPAAAPASKAKKPAKAAPAPATPAAPAAPPKPAKAAAPKAAPAKPEASTPKPAPKAPGKAKPEAPPPVAAKPAAPKPAAPKPAAAKAKPAPAPAPEAPAAPAKPAKGSKAKAEPTPKKAAPPQAPKPARGKAAPAAAEEPAEDDELDADLAAAEELEDLDIDLEGDEDEDDDEDGEAAAPAAPAKGKGAPKAPPAKGATGKAPAAPAGRGTGKGEAPDAGGGGLAGLLRALGAARATPPKRPAGGMDLGDDDEAAPAAAPRKAPADEDEAPAAPPPPKVQRTVPPMPPRKPGVITLAISPDADDAFMLFALEHGLVATEDRKYEVVRDEVARLNEEAQRGTYDVTAFSFGSWPQLVDRYLVLPSGGSLGDGVGPVVVSKTPVRSSEVSGLQVGVPGLTTTGALVLRMWLHPAKLNLVALPFEAVPLAVAAGEVRAGVLIHEAQLTYRSQGLVLVKDLGAWWTERTEGLPLPLGGMLVRRDIPQEERAKINIDVKRSIAYAMGHRADALAHAARFAKGLTMALLERYIDNYVNELSLDMGERGRQAVHTLFQEAKRQGLVRDVVELEMA